MAESDEVTHQKYCAPNGYTAILLATYNGEKYLEEQLESLRNQTYSDFICFIHDDNSTDKTQEIAEAYCKRYPDQFVFTGSYKTGGAKYNFMKLLQDVEADNYMFCDQDDVWMPDKIEKTYLRMQQIEKDNPEKGNCPICVFSDAVVVDEELKVISDSFYKYDAIDHPEKMGLEDLFYRNVALGCTMMFNRVLRDRATMVEVTDLIYMHDEFLILIAASCGILVRMDEPLLYYRQHGNNAIGAHEARTYGQKIFRLFKIKEWVDEKKNFLRIREQMVKALLICLESNSQIKDRKTHLSSDSDTQEIIADIDSNPKYQDSIRAVKKFLKQENSSLLIKLLHYYRWKYK